MKAPTPMAVLVVEAGADRQREEMCQALSRRLRAYQRRHQTEEIEPLELRSMLVFMAPAPDRLYRRGRAWVGAWVGQCANAIREEYWRYDEPSDAAVAEGNYHIPTLRLAITAWGWSGVPIQATEL